jgi:hypothetical protein
MNEQETIQFILNEKLAGEGSQLSVRMVVSTMQRLLGREEKPTFALARAYLYLILSNARVLKLTPGMWTYKGRFSEALFDRQFLPGGDGTLGILADLKHALMNMDGASQEQFRIESAQQLLDEVIQIGQSLEREFSE